MDCKTEILRKANNVKISLKKYNPFFPYFVHGRLHSNCRLKTLISPVWFSTRLRKRAINKVKKSTGSVPRGSFACEQAFGPKKNREPVHRLEEARSFNRKSRFILPNYRWLINWVTKTYPPSTPVENCHPIFVCLPMSLYQLVEPAIVVTMMMAALQWNDEVIFWSNISHLVTFLAEFPFIKFMKTSSLTRDDVKLANEW